jgi:hypothetical protein
MRPSVIAITDGALRVPTADDLLALIDANSERRYTNALGVSGPATETRARSRRSRASRRRGNRVGSLEFGWKMPSPRWA